jgi:UPF0042 nucleotide-binding protein
LEDLGWFVIDNVPAALIPRVADLTDTAPADRQRLAFVIGRSGTSEVPELVSVISQLRAADRHIRVLFLDAADEILIRRFEGTRRRHPLASESVAASIIEERSALEELRSVADIILETGELTSNQLRRRIAELFESAAHDAMMRTSITSFGYKHGMPRDVDLVFDCRFLPNPYWDEALRPLTGLDQPVREFVLRQPDSERFIEEVTAMLAWQIPAFQREGKSYLTVAFGCTGGRHRSVAIAEEVSRRLGGGIAVFHRDVER